MSLAALLTDTLTVETVTRSDDSAGGRAEVWATKAASVPCRRQGANYARQTTNDQLQIAYTDQFYVGAGVAVSETADRIVYGGAVYKIVGLRQVTGGAGAHHQVVYTRRVV